jgi:molybdate transport system permease protein
VSATTDGSASTGSTSAAPSRPVAAGRAPAALWVPAAVALAFLGLPLVGLLARAPWTDLDTLLSQPAVTDALRLSLVCSFGSLGLALVLGVPLAWLLARRDFRGRAVVRALVLVPLVLPPVVGGVALLLAFGRNGVLGPPLDALGVRLPFSTAGAVVAGAFVAMPFLVLAVEGAIAGLDRRYEEVAATLGSSPLRVFLRVTLPLVAPGVAAGSALAWARALGEFGATITFAGNLPGETQTLPLAVYLLLQNDPDAATAVSLLLLAVSVAVLVLLRGRWAAPTRRGVTR